MHGIVHIGWVQDRTACAQGQTAGVQDETGWVQDQTGGYRGQMAVLVKRNGLLGSAYMAAIKPFRHLIVYPAMMREIERSWRAPAGDPAPALA
jgi:Protein of unknown function (DUF2867)